jgi:hypothetical protein
MFSVSRELAALPHHPDGVCGVIGDFLQAWSGSSGETRAEALEIEVVDAERRLDVRLPIALRWLLTTIGAEDPVLQQQDPLVPASSLQIDKDGVIVYRKENQNCAQWGVRVSDLELLDPPVLWKNMQESGGWSAYQDRLSVELLEGVIGEVVLSPSVKVLQAELFDGRPDELSSFQSLDIPSHVFWAVPDGPPVEWFGRGECLIRNDGDVWLWIFGRTASEVKSVAKEIRAEWSGLPR